MSSNMDSKCGLRLMAKGGLFVIVICFLTVSSFAAEQNIYQWRGDGSGKFLETKPQVKWGREKSVVWKTSMKDWSNASPIVIDGKIFVCSEPTDLVCLDQKTGKILWESSNDYDDAKGISAEEKKKKEASKADHAKLEEALEELESEKRKLKRILKRKPDNPEAKAKDTELTKKISELRSQIGGGATMPKTHKANGYTSYTPVSDGKYVYVANGLGIVAAYNLTGKRIWIKKMALPDHNTWGGSTTPLLASGKLIVRFKDTVALDPETGDELWRTSVKQNFGTPVIFQIEGKDALFTNKGEVLLVDSGKKLCDLGLEEPLEEKSWATFNKPVIEDGVIYTIHGFNGKVGEVYAFEIPQTIAEAEKGLKKLWEAEVAKERYYSSLIIHDGKVFALGHKYTLSVLDQKTGKKIDEKQLGNLKGTAFPSMVLAGKHLLASSDEGQTAVLDIGNDYKEVAFNELERFRSSPIFIGNRMYLRASEFMYAFE